MTSSLERVLVFRRPKNGEPPPPNGKGKEPPKGNTIPDLFAWVAWEYDLGKPTSPLTQMPDGVGWKKSYGQSTVYCHPEGPARKFGIMNPGPIQDRWLALGGVSGFAGYPLGIADRYGIYSDGFGQNFQGASIYVSPMTDAHEIHGPIRAKWNAIGGGAADGIGFPTTDETGAPDGVGRYNDFFSGSIYWHPDLGAQEVRGDIRAKWLATGGVGGLLGYPVTDETPTPDGVGRYNHFRGGSIYWHPNTGAFEVHGPIRDLWSQLGWERGAAGYPVSDMLSTEDHVATFNLFQHAAIVAAPDTDTVQLEGAVGLRRSFKAPVRIDTDDVRLSEGEWMRAIVTVSARGRVDGETRIWTMNSITGFHGATVVCLYDSQLNKLWSSTPHVYGVDSLGFSWFPGAVSSDRRELWQAEQLPDDVKNSWAIAQVFHMSAGRNMFLTDLNIALDEAKKAVDVVGAIKGLFGGSSGKTKPTATENSTG